MGGMGTERPGPYRRVLAGAASAVLVTAAYDDIRDLAGLRENAVLPPEAPPGTDFVEWIETLADAIHNLPGPRGETGSVSVAIEIRHRAYFRRPSGGLFANEDFLEEISAWAVRGLEENARARRFWGLGGWWESVRTRYDVLGYPWLVRSDEQRVWWVRTLRDHRLKMQWIMGRRTYRDSERERELLSGFPNTSMDLYRVTPHPESDVMKEGRRALDHYTE